MTKAKVKTPTPEDPAADHLDEVEFEEKDPIPDDSGGEEQPLEPKLDEPGWAAYVLAQLTPDEMFDDKPKVAGLRRVASLLLGPILENSADCRQVPTLANGQYATVQARVVILWNKDLSYGELPAQRLFTGLADVSPGNADPKYARFASALAETRAEGRALRKALCLAVVSAEETTDLPIEEAGMDGFITPSQRNFIDMKCKARNISVVKFMNMGKTKYTDLRRVPTATAQKMLAKLDEYQRNVHPIPADIQGYDSNWNGEGD